MRFIFSRKLIIHIWFFSFIFIFPNNLFLQLQPNGGYVHGLRIDYLIPKLFLVDIWLLLGTMLGHRQIKAWLLDLLHFISKHRSDWQVIILVFLSVVLMIRQFFTPFSLVAVWGGLQLLLLLVCGVWLWQEKIKTQIFVMALVVSVIFQSSLGLYQFVAQRPLLPYRFLGETQFHQALSPARHNFQVIDELFHTHLGVKIIPYGSTPHPNVLAGILTMQLGVLWWLRKQTNTLILVGISILAGGVIILTQSISAWLSVMVMLIVIFLSHRLKSVSNSFLLGLIIGVVLISPIALSLIHAGMDKPSFSISRRVELQNVAWQTIVELPIFGIGYGQFTAHVEDKLKTTELAVFVQPVHHVGLLMLSEIGILGLLAVTGGLLASGKKMPSLQQKKMLLALVCILPILVLDHYVYTIRSGQVMVMLWVVFLVKYVDDV